MATTADAIQNPALNVAQRLTAVARQMPRAVAVAEPASGGRWRQVTFGQLDDDSNRIACGLRQLGVVEGTRLALLVRPGIDFIALVFALFKSGAVTILIDPGLGRRNMVRCLAEARPDGFVAIPLAHAVRTLLRGRFPQARINVTVGRRWFWGGVTLEQLRRTPGDGGQLAPMRPDAPAAIIFTSGSTGPPKGVLYSHGNFDAQVDQIRDLYGIQPGEIDLPCFPLFGLFNCAMGVTAVIPDMDASRPAQVDPAKIVKAAQAWQVTQTFGSPAVLDKIGSYCVAQGIRLPSIRRVLSAGAPVPIRVLEAMRACTHTDGDVYTPYGATEALPVASISASEVLGQTAARTRQGAGVCVGRKFSGIQWKVIRIVDGPIPCLDDATQLPEGEIGELIVQGPVVTLEYVTRPETNRLAKIGDGDGFWHRMGDVGYLDQQQRFWFCGRLSHRVLTPGGPLFTIPCEAIFNQHPDVNRSALVGVGPPGEQRPVVVLEPRKDRWPGTKRRREEFFAEVSRLGQQSPNTAGIRDFLIKADFPVDVRHNAKIFREKLAVWAARQLGR